jgi:hypothetical protein
MIATSRKPGFVLPSVLLITGALLIMAVGAMMITGIERGTARAYLDRQQAELAAHAALEQVRGILVSETANDDFVVLQSTMMASITNGFEPAPHLFIARGTSITDDSGRFVHRYIPLFSTLSTPADAPFAMPIIEPLLGNDDDHVELTTLPYLDKIRTAWIPLTDDHGRTVARYAFWAEDLQSRVNPAIAGNQNGENDQHARVAWPFPAPGLNNQTESEQEPALNQIALYALDPAATDDAQGEIGRKLLQNRHLLVSPECQLAASEIQPPLDRLTASDPVTNGKCGDLVLPVARAVEKALAPHTPSYLEQALIPFAHGISASVVGTPKLNLNRLLAASPAQAVDEMASFIKTALPNFEQRKGGFPEDYLKTIAANTLDYADQDAESTNQSGSYRGIDSYAFTTEIVLKVNYVNMTIEDDRQFLNFNIRLFAELYNPTNVDISGSAKLSYEVALKASPIGSGTGSDSFDSEELLDDPLASSHPLEKIDGTYWTPPVTVTLRPNEYQCHLFADVTYRIDQGTVTENPIAGNTPFSLTENKGESGCSLKWNDQLIERQAGMVRQQGFIYGVNSIGNRTGGYEVGDNNRVLSKAHLPALLYQKAASADFYGNTGDPRISHYLNRTGGTPLDESAYPQNTSPNRRTVRRKTYLEDDQPQKPKVYARMLPSEWPDGGHDSPVGSWTPGTNDATEITDTRFDFPYDPNEKFLVIQRISNRGIFLSASELGHVFDPIMFAPVFANDAVTKQFWNKHLMPTSENRWPDVRTTAHHANNSLYGGGNTLRIGRPEHPAFDFPGDAGMHASALLDLFHAGQPLAEDPALHTGPLVKINGHININTASRDALRLLAAGKLVMDPALARRLDDAHELTLRMAPPVEPTELGAPSNVMIADRIADAVIASRPYTSPSCLALAKDTDGEAVFGNRNQYPEAENIHWSDAAAEEVFARVYQAATVRSRNFRVWIVAQALNPATGSRPIPQVLAEVRKVVSLHAAPGERAEDGRIRPENFKTRILHVNDF